MAFSFEKLLVYPKSVDFADAVCAATEQFHRGYGFLVDQLKRAALSIASNIAEGNGRFTVPDRKHFFGIARGSVQECVPRKRPANPFELAGADWRVPTPLDRGASWISGHGMTRKEHGTNTVFGTANVR